MLVARRRLLCQAAAIADVATLVAGFGAAYAIAGSCFHRRFESFAGYLWLVLPIAVIWLACLSAFGLYHSAAYRSARGLLLRLMQTQLLAGLLLLSLMYLTRSEVISRLLLQMFLGVSFIFLLAQKFALRLYLGRARWGASSGRRKVVLVSDWTDAERYFALMRTRVSMLADVIKVLAPNPSAPNGLCRADVYPSLETVDELPTLLDTQVVDEVIALSRLDPSVLERLARWCSARGTLLRIWLELPCPAVGSWAAEYFGQDAFLLSLAAVPRNPFDLAIKRLLDVLGATIGIILCGVVYLWCALRLRRETGGSILFRQQRVGRNGRPFVLYKFRTMCHGAEQQRSALEGRNQMTGPIFKIEDDPRVTCTGRKLRRRHLDELPQFWNVLKGEMSLVGTRPPTTDEIVAYAEHHRRRLSMKPGITGLWQLNGNGAVRNFEDVVKLDCEYIDNWSLWLDAKILVRTVNKVTRGDGW